MMSLLNIIAMIHALENLLIMDSFMHEKIPQRNQDMLIRFPDATNPEGKKRHSYARSFIMNHKIQFERYTGRILVNDEEAKKLQEYGCELIDHGSADRSRNVMFKLLEKLNMLRDQPAVTTEEQGIKNYLETLIFDNIDSFQKYLS